MSQVGPTWMALVNCLLVLGALATVGLMVALVAVLGRLARAQQATAAALERVAESLEY